MTRINDRHVIQMLNDEKIVFVDDSTGVEVVMPLAAMEAILQMWAIDAAQGKTFNVKAGLHERITFQPHEYDAVKQAVEYFQSVAATPEDQRGEPVIRSFDSIDEALDFMKGLQS